MHEAGLMADLLRRIEATVAAEGASRAVRVEVWVGALAHLSPDHLRAHFETIAASSVAAGAELVVTASSDVQDAHAEDILLMGLEVED